MLPALTGTNLIVYAICIIISLVLHEMMHGVMAYWLGDTTAKDAGRLSLNPIDHIDPYTTILMPIITLWILKVPLLAAKPVPFNPYRVKFKEYGAALVGLAGPATNLVLALLGAGAFRILNDANATTAVLNFLIIFVEVNVAVMIFNLIPIPPLDGSRALYAVAPEPLQEVMARFESMGFTAIVLILAIFILVPGFSNLLGNLNAHVLQFLLG